MRHVCTAIKHGVMFRRANLHVSFMIAINLLGNWKKSFVCDEKLSWEKEIKFSDQRNVHRSSFPATSINFSCHKCHPCVNLLFIFLSARACVCVRSCAMGPQREMINSEAMKPSATHGSLAITTHKGVRVLNFQTYEGEYKRSIKLIFGKKSDVDDVGWNFFDTTRW